MADEHREAGVFVGCGRDAADGVDNAKSDFAVFGERARLGRRSAITFCGGALLYAAS